MFRPHHHRRSDIVELVLGGRQHEEGLWLLADHPGQVRGGVAGLQLGDQLPEEVQGGGGGQLPAQFLQDQHLHVLQLGQGDAAVREDDQLVEGERPRVGQLGGDAEAGGGQELQLGGVEVSEGEDGVQERDATQEHPGRAVLLAHLQHPVGDDLPVVDQDLALDLGDVVPAPTAGVVLPLGLQQVVQDSGAEEDPVRAGPHEGRSGRLVTVTVHLHVSWWSTSNLLTGSI